MSLPKVLERAIPVYAGDSWMAGGRFRAGGIGYDLSLWSSWKAWISTTNGVKVADLTVDTSRIGEGRVYLRMTKAETRALGDLNKRFFNFDCQADLGEQRITWMRGQLSVTDDITKGD